MRKTVVSAAAASAALFGAAMAEECTFDGDAPSMPDPQEATAEDRAAKITEIKNYQSGLNAYRECLTAIYQNEELELEVRQKALDAYNATVKDETKMVEAWQVFDQEYKEANS